MSNDKLLQSKYYYEKKSLVLMYYTILDTYTISIYAYRYLRFIFLPKSEVNCGSPLYKCYNLGFIVYTVYTFQFSSRIIILFEPYIGVLNLHCAFNFKQCIIHYVDLFYNSK